MNAAKEHAEMETFTLERDGAPDLRLTGKCIAHATSQTPMRNKTRWTVLDLYRTQSGKLVCHEIGKTQWESEKDRFAVYIAETEDELLSQVGHGSLAKELYAEADIECVEDID